jgi:hypothetical protein
MTDTPPNRLWPLALMGWLAAFPPISRDAAAAPAQNPLSYETGTPESRAARLREPRPLDAPLSAAERAVIRRRRRREAP